MGVEIAERQGHETEPAVSDNEIRMDAEMRSFRSVPDNASEWLQLVRQYKFMKKDVRMVLRIRIVLLSTLLFTLLKVSVVTAQTSAGYAQQIFVMTKLMPSAKSIGIISNNVTDALTQAAARAGLPFGINVFVAKAEKPKDIPELYRMLLKKGVKIIWLPDKNDAMLLNLGFEFLRETTLEDKIGLCVPIPKMVSEGALCCVQSNGNKLTVYIDKRVAQIVGANIPDDPASTVTYVLK
jgi:hypothetical protein